MAAFGISSLKPRQYYQAGGSVNPFEETAQAARDWSRPNITVGPRSKEAYETRGGEHLGFVQKESDRLAPSGRFTQQGNPIYSPYPRSEAIAMRKVFHPLRSRVKSGEAYISPLGTTAAMQVEPEWYAQRGYDFSDDLGIYNYPMIGESTDLYFNNYQAGGSVNPFEETARAGRNYKRDTIPDFARGKRYEPDLSREPTPPFKGPYTPDLDRDIPDAYPLGGDEGIFNIMSRRIQDNPVFQKSKSIYDWVDQNPFMPEFDLGDQQVGWEYNPELWGGNLDIGFGMKEDNPYGYFGYTREL